MRISDWSSDVCSSDLPDHNIAVKAGRDLCREFQSLLDRVDQQESKQADRKGQREPEPALAAPANGGIEKHPQCDRHHSDKQADEADTPPADHVGHWPGEKTRTGARKERVGQSE